MITIDESNLNLKNAKSPLATIEVDIDSLEAQGETFPSVIYKSLVEFAENEEDVCFSVYTYFTQSITFHEPTNSFFIGSVGCKRVLEALLLSFSSIKGVRARFSDHIDPRQSIMEYHIENGYVWQRYEPGSWWREEEEPQKQPSSDIENLDSYIESPARYRVARNDASIRTIKSRIEQVFGLPEGSVALLKPNGNKIKSNASIGTLRKQWDY